jgi:hypothetical protein
LLAAPVENRLTPFEYYFPMQLNLTSKMELPTGLELDNMPKPAHIADAYSSADVQFEQAGSSITEIFSFESSPFQHPASDYNDFAQSRENLLDALEPQLHLVKR